MAVSPYINRFLQPDTIVPNFTNPQSLNRFSYVQNNPVVFNDPSGHCFESSSVWDDLNCLVSSVSATLSYIKENPFSVTIKGKNFVVPVVIPNSGLKPDLVFHNVSFKTVRIAGRVGDDMVIPSLVAGAALTVAPEQIEDLEKGAPWSEHLADFLIDGIGFVGSEILGDVIGKGSTFVVGPAAPLVEVGVDWYAGYVYDNFMDDKRYDLQWWIEQTQITPPAPPAPAIPAPTPPTQIPPLQTPPPPASSGYGLPIPI